MSLEPIREQIPAAAFEKLTDCLAVCVGIDALLVLRDICGLPGEKAEERMVWMATAILDRALDGASASAFDLRPRTSIMQDLKSSGVAAIAKSTALLKPRPAR